MVGRMPMRGGWLGGVCVVCGPRRVFVAVTYPPGHVDAGGGVRCVTTGSTVPAVNVVCRRDTRTGSLSTAR